MVVYNIGDVIAELSPFAHCVKGDDRDIRCHYCLELRNTLRWCAKCRVVRYCGRECQTKDWKAVHQSECKVLSRASSSEKSFLLSETHYRLILRVILILQESPGKEYQEIGTFNGPRSFSSLIGNGEKVFSFSEDYSIAISAMQRVLGNLAVNIEFSKLKEIVAKVFIHFADIYVASGGIGGKGLYIGSSGFDHSCMPNSIRCPSNGLNIKIRAMKRFDTKFEAPLISYFDESLPLALRQSVLDMFTISCKCPRCLTPHPALDAENIMRREKFQMFVGVEHFGSDFPSLHPYGMLLTQSEES